MAKRHLAQYDSDGRKMPIYLEANEVDVNGRPLDEVIGEGVYDPQYVHTDNNYTTAEKNKLAGLRNYDDTDVQTAIRNINDAIDRLTGTSDTTEIIDTMNEVIDFLSGFDNTDSLANELVSIRQQLANKLNAGDAYNKHEVDDLLDAKQDIINDLVTIRNGARLGATAVQTETDPTVPSWAKQPRKPTYTAAEVGALPANTTIPQGTVTAIKVNNGQPVYPNASGVVSLTISASGAQVQPDWDETNTESPAYIQNKPDVANAISVNQHSYVMNNNHAFVIPDYYTKTEVDDKVANAGKVKSVSVNGGQPVQPVNGNVNLQGVATEGYVDDAVDDKLTQVVVNEISGAADIITIDDADLAFVDEDGNIAMRVSEGHVETQNFDSRQVVTNTNAIQQLQSQIGGNVQTDVVVKEDTDAAFDISDSSGNVVFRIGNDGHIETKGFNSSDADGSDVFKATKMTPNCVVHGKLPINGIGPNSIAMFKEAYRVGYRWFECDSKPCRDNGAILTHDSGNFTFYDKSDPTQTPITVNDFSGYDSTDLAENYTWTASTYTDGVLTTEGKQMETLAEAIWYVCYFLRCPLHVDKLGLTVAAQYQASSYAESLGVGQYVFHEIGSASALLNYANWDIPLNMIFFLGSNYMNDISNIAAHYKTQKNNIIFYFGKSTSTPSATLKAIADATHEVGCYAMTWDFVTSQIEELRRWFKAGFDFLLTTGITNADV